jgi:hypothetical protein
VLAQELVAAHKFKAVELNLGSMLRSTGLWCRAINQLIFCDHLYCIALRRTKQNRNSKQYQRMGPQIGQKRATPKHIDFKTSCKQLGELGRLGLPSGGDTDKPRTSILRQRNGPELVGETTQRRRNSCRGLRSQDATERRTDKKRMRQNQDRRDYRLEKHHPQSDIDPGAVGKM